MPESSKINHHLLELTEILIQSLAVRKVFHRLVIVIFDVVVVKNFGVPAETYQSVTLFFLLPRIFRNKPQNATVFLKLGFLTVFVKLLVHHDFPGINRKVCIIK